MQAVLIRPQLPIVAHTFKELYLERSRGEGEHVRPKDGVKDSLPALRFAFRIPERLMKVLFCHDPGILILQQHRGISCIKTALCHMELWGFILKSGRHTYLFLRLLSLLVPGKLSSVFSPLEE